MTQRVDFTQSLYLVQAVGRQRQKPLVDKAGLQSDEVLWVRDLILQRAGQFAYAIGELLRGFVAN
jgi:hypothetical protein